MNCAPWLDTAKLKELRKDGDIASRHIRIQEHYETLSLTEPLPEKQGEQSKQGAYHEVDVFRIMSRPHAHLHGTKGNGISLGKKYILPVHHARVPLLLISGWRRATTTPWSATAPEWTPSLTVGRTTPRPTNRPLPTLLPCLNDDPDRSLRAIDAQSTLTTSVRRKRSDNGFLRSFEVKELEEGTSFAAHDLDILDGAKAREKSNQLLWRDGFGDTLCAHGRINKRH
jgi:hypothetical protein